MLFSQSVTYAIESLRYLSKLPPKTIRKTKTIAEELGIPEYFLGKILTQLVRKGILVSFKGPTGGVSLKAKPEKLTVHRIMKKLDVTFNFGDTCVIGLKKCSKSNPCPFHEDVMRFKQAIIDKSKNTTLMEFPES
jgi:Rrf2 family protein